MEVQLIKLNKIKVNDKNPRTITEDKLRRLIESILVFPKMLSIRPIVVDDKGVALGGNMRTRALKEIKKLGRDAIPERLQQIRQYANKPQEEKNELLAHWDAWFKDETVPVIHAESLTEEEKREFIIKDNSSFGAWDWDVLANEWESEQLDDWGVDTWQIDETEDEGNDNEVNEDNFDAGNETITPKVQYGDIWLLGEHRLMCGDSTDEKCLEMLFNGKKCEMTFTSPPYNGNNKMPQQGMKKGNTVTSKHLYSDGYEDNMQSEQYIKFCRDVLDYCFHFTDGFVFWNVNYNANSRFEYISQIYDKLPYLIEQICWRKQSSIPFKGSMKRIWEPIYLFSTNGGKLQLNECVENLWDVSNYNVNGGDHFACFPVELVAKAFQITNAQSVFDPFGGTGTTMIAAEQLHRKCFMMELDAHYCDVIIARWEMLTGEQAVKIG